MPKPRVALVTGANSFTGRHLVPVLQARGYRVVGLGTPVAGLEETFAGDLRDAEALRSCVAQVQPTHVVHLAGISFVGHGDVGAFYDVNVIGTLHLLDALQALPTRPQKVLLASSANVYGTPPVEVIDESICHRPVNHYACSKLAMEQMARNYAGQLPMCIVRPFNYTGVGQNEKFLVPKIVSHFCKQAPYIELGNLDVARDFSDVRDVVQRYARLLEADLPSGEVVNVCSGQGYALRDILQMAESLTGHHMEVRVNPAFVRANEVPRLLGSSARLQQYLGPLSQIPLRETLRWMLEDCA